MGFLEVRVVAAGLTKEAHCFVEASVQNHTKATRTVGPSTSPSFNEVLRVVTHTEPQSAGALFSRSTSRPLSVLTSPSFVVR
jgi:hypothetical protein